MHVDEQVDLIALGAFALMCVTVIVLSLRLEALFELLWTRKYGPDILEEDEAPTKRYVRADQPAPRDAVTQPYRATSDR